MQVFILAGGRGTRLKPYTITLPKPLVPVGDYPILELIIRQLKTHDFKEFVFAVGHHAQLIQSYFGRGEKLDVDIRYSLEEKPLGTAGPLSLIDGFQDNFLVMNADDLTNLDYSAFFRYHIDNKADITIATYKKTQKVDLGVLQLDENGLLTDYIEKPTYDFNVSMGIYAFNKSVLQYIPKNEYFDFPSLIKVLLQKNKKILSYGHEGIWLDIGRPEDYEKAISVFSENPDKFIGSDL